MKCYMADHREHRKNVRVISKTKIADDGAGQIIVDNKVAYIAHMSTGGITLVDVGNPHAPKVLSKVASPPNTHSHKVQVSGDVMLINNERLGNVESWTAGIRVFDIADKTAPREIGFMPTTGKGAHRMWFVDGKYAHVTAQPEGFTDCIYLILDLSDPTSPTEVGRFWLPGMWEAGGEKPTWEESKKVRAHGPPYVCGDQAYLGWTDGGFTIIDISDYSKPRMVAHMSWCPPLAG